MSELSGTTKRVLDFVTQMAALGEPLTVRQVQKALALSSTSVAQYHLKKLEDAGYIARRQGRHRSIRLLNGHPGDVVMVFRGEDAELVRAFLGERPAEKLLEMLKMEPAQEKAG